MLCLGLNALLAQLQERSLTDIVRSMVPVQPVLWAEPFYCYDWNTLTSSCPVVSTPAVPGNPANTRTLQGYRAANPSLRNQPWSPEPNYSSVGMAQANQSHGEGSGSHTSHGISNSHYSNEKCSLLQAHKVKRRHALRRPLKGSHLTGSWTDLKETNSPGLNLMSGLHSEHFPMS